MQDYQYSPIVRLLVMNHSDEKEAVLYTASNYIFKLPKIGPRPPFYVHPRYQPYYPLI
ncbi:hypothetical protein [Bacillus dakarensis]|uniref:hypothetical protein n=1 Tax=Robertmurraya dakarensis TaxID=1926278 RepID=UPI00192A2DE2|nr:hypothetical protein [Bacillus dakarensis]